VTAKESGYRGRRVEGWGRRVVRLRFEIYAERKHDLIESLIGDLDLKRPRHWLRKWSARRFKSSKKKTVKVFIHWISSMRLVFRSRYLAIDLMSSAVQGREQVLLCPFDAIAPNILYKMTSTMRFTSRYRWPLLKACGLEIPYCLDTNLAFIGDELKFPDWLTSQKLDESRKFGNCIQKKRFSRRVHVCEVAILAALMEYIRRVIGQVFGSVLSRIWPEKVQIRTTYSSYSKFVKSRFWLFRRNSAF